MDRNADNWEALRNIYGVALRKESVDRNQRIAKPFREQFVALRKESVDRNWSILP